MLGLLLKGIEEMYVKKDSQPYLVTLYKALFTAAYFGLLRIGETTCSPHAILARNVHIATNKNKLLFKLESSKTHNKGDKPQIIKICGKGNKKPIVSICPFITLKSYINTRPASKGEAEQFAQVFLHACWP